MKVFKSFFKPRFMYIFVKKLHRMDSVIKEGVWHLEGTICVYLTFFNYSNRPLKQNYFIHWVYTSISNYLNVFFGLTFLCLHNNSQSFLGTVRGPVTSVNYSKLWNSHNSGHPLMPKSLAVILWIISSIIVNHS